VGQSELWPVGERACCVLWERQRVCSVGEELYSVGETASCDLWEIKRLVICGRESGL